MKLRHGGYTPILWACFPQLCCGPIEAMTPWIHPDTLGVLSATKVAAPLKQRLALVYGEHSVSLPQLPSRGPVEACSIWCPSGSCGTRLNAGRGARFCNLRAERRLASLCLQSRLRQVVLETEIAEQIRAKQRKVRLVFAARIRLHNPHVDISQDEPACLLV